MFNIIDVKSYIVYFIFMCVKEFVNCFGIFWIILRFGKEKIDVVLIVNDCVVFLKFSWFVFLSVLIEIDIVFVLICLFVYIVNVKFNMVNCLDFEGICCVSRGICCISFGYFCILIICVCWLFWYGKVMWGWLGFCCVWINLIELII